MRNQICILIFFVLSTDGFKSYSQDYDFSVFAFRIIDNDSIITSLHDVKGFNHPYGTILEEDPQSKFEVNAIYLSEDVEYQSVYKHKKGIWLLDAQEINGWNTLRFFSIQRKQNDGNIETMRIFLNYDYNSCEMPCIFGESEFKVSDIQFSKGNYMFLDRLSMSDWKNSSKNIIKIDDDILNYLFRNKIILWDTKMKESYYEYHSK